jgi:hypothetical protein
MSTVRSPRGEFRHRLEQAVDLSINVLDQEKWDFGNSPHPALWRYPPISGALLVRSVPNYIA